MAEIHIVLENPQHSQRKEHKKRPRLVTSCDNCRTKKLRCIKPERVNSRCDACVHANVPCEFRDREQYLAERSRLAKNSGGSVSSGSGPSTPNFAQSPHAFYDSLVHGANYLPGPSSQVLTNPITSSTHMASSEYAGTTANAIYTALPANAAQNDLHPPLFDPRCGERPNPLFMISFIDAFFRNGGPQFGFLYYDEIVRLFFQDSLSYILQACIAAWAVRYNSIPEFSNVDGRIVSSKYIAHAKTLLASMVYTPSLDNLHSLIILAWLGSEQLEEFCTYAKLANQMLRDLHVGGTLTSANVDQQILDSTWSSVNHLVIVASKTQQPSSH